MRCHWLKITTNPVPIQSEALFHVSCGVGLNGWNELFLYYMKITFSVLNNNKKIVQISLLFFSKTRKSFVGGTVNLKIKKLWPNEGVFKCLELIK